MEVNHNHPIHDLDEIVDTHADERRINLSDIEAVVDRRVKVEIEKVKQESQASFITIFGIFASIISFLTIEFQFLKTLSTAHRIIGFTCVLWALLMSFTLALHHVITSALSGETRPAYKYLMLCIATVFFAGIVLMLCVPL